MDFSQALQQVGQILDEERVYPTAHYALSLQEETVLAGSIREMLDVGELRAQRGKRPREIKETSKWAFESTNYTLLTLVIGQIEESQRKPLVSSMLARLGTAPGCVRGLSNAFPSWQWLTSELPLILEYCVRSGYKHELFRAIRESPLIPGHVVLLRYVEEMIALSFLSLSADEYIELSSLASAMADKAIALRRFSGGIRIADDAAIERSPFCFEVEQAAKAIVEQCRKARFLYIKGALTEGINLEVNQDKARVENYLAKLGFDPLLVASLNKADELYRTANTAFDLKSSMGHLRSFLEELHAASVPGTAKGWGPQLTHLRQAGLLSDTEEKFVASLYTLISDEAVHPLIAEREYARLARNMVVEYGLLFLTKLEKSGLRTA